MDGEGPAGAVGQGTDKANKASADPVVYSSGEIELNAKDIASDGFSPWSVSRSYANTRDFGATPFGNHWYLDQMPFVVDASTHYLVQFSALSTQVFTKINATTNAPLRYEVQTFQPQGADLIFTDGVGNRWLFYDFSNATAALRGKFRAYQDAGGNLTVIGYNANAQPITATRSAADATGPLVEQFRYAWGTNGQISSIQRVLTRNGVESIVRQVVYAYYSGAATDFGPAGQLKTVQVQDGSGTVLETDHYRYWKTGETYLGGVAQSPSAVGQLKYVLSPRAFARLAASNDPTTAPDSTIASYATKYFEYDDNGRVTKQVLRGEGIDATSTQTYAYSVNPNTVARDYNLWTWKTVETLSDGTINTIYGNYAGATLAFATREAAAPNRTWIHAYRYDAQGREIWHATPSAVTGITEAANDLGLSGAVSANAPNVLDAAGLIESSVFATATTATVSAAGDVSGLRKQRRIQQGELGTPQVLDLQTYQLHQGN